MGEKIGQRLKRLRIAKNLSVKRVATELGVGVTTYREWEYGRSISGEPYVQLARLYSVSLYELLTGQQSKTDQLLESVILDLKKARIQCD